MYQDNVREICSIIGTDFLRVTSTSTEYASAFEDTHKDYPLHQITKKELIDLRYSGKPGFVLKSGDNLYYTQIPKNLRFNGNHTPYKHLCGEGCQKVCKHCPKIDAWTTDFHMRQGYTFRQAVFMSGRIEKYDFIPMAFESFNTTLDAYGIIECKNFVGT